MFNDFVFTVLAPTFVIDHRKKLWNAFDCSCRQNINIMHPVTLYYTVWSIKLFNNHIVNYFYSIQDVCSVELFSC